MLVVIWRKFPLGSEYDLIFCFVMQFKLEQVFDFISDYACPKYVLQTLLCNFGNVVHRSRNT